MYDIFFKVMVLILILSAEPVWNLMEDMKRCFDSKPEIVKCIEGKSKYFMSKFGENKKEVSKSEVVQR